MNLVVKGYLRLARPANLPTAAADIFAGVAIAGFFSEGETTFIPILSVVNLVFTSVFLYAGGVVLNDVFDFRLDQIERPERPIPSGLIPLKYAAIFGAILMLTGIGMAFYIHKLSGIIALILAFSIVLYDALSKKHDFFGPVNMGLCRGLNLILGISIFGLMNEWWYAIVPFIYIFAITLISRGEVHGNNKGHIIWAGILYAHVFFGVAGIVMLKTDRILQTAPFLVLFAFLVYWPLANAYRSNSPRNIKKAVIAGVLSIIALDAALAVGFSVWWYGLIILLLLPLSILLSKIFAVT